MKTLIIARNLSLLVLYHIFARIIFLEKKALGYHWLKLFKVSRLTTSLIAYLGVLILTRIWLFRSKEWRISISINTCLNFVNANIALGIKKPNLELSLINDWDLAKLNVLLLLNLDKFAFSQNFFLSILLSLLTLSIVLFSPRSLRSFSTGSTFLVLSIEVNDVVIWLKP